MVEMMFGASILLVAILAVLYSFISLMSLNESSKNLTTAVNDAQYALEQIKSQSFNNIPAFISSYSPTQFANLSNENITFPGPVYTSTLDTITVQITWNERNATKTFSTTTRFAQ